MKQNNPDIERYRVRKGVTASNESYGNNGHFLITGPGRKLSVIVSDQGGWEHVSVSVKGKLVTPTWDEMCFVKDLFWQKDECVVQYHPPEADYINFHPGVLHLWRPVDQAIPMPPKIYV